MIVYDSSSRDYYIVTDITKYPFCRPLSKFEMEVLNLDPSVLTEPPSAFSAAVKRIVKQQMAQWCNNLEKQLQELE